MKSPNEGRPKDWPTNEELEAQPSPAEGPFPRDYKTVFVYKQPDGTYVEQLRIYTLTRPRTAEEQMRGDVPFQRATYNGRVYRIAKPGEKHDISVFQPHDFSQVHLVQDT